MMVVAPAPKNEKASGIKELFVPLGGLRLRESLACIGAALAAVHWVRIIIIIPHPNPLLRKLCIKLNILFIKLLIISLWSM